MNMHKKGKKHIGLYNALKEWFDPAMEGSPYDSGFKVRQVAFKQEKAYAPKAWMTA